MSPLTEDEIQEIYEIASKNFYEWNRIGTRGQVIMPQQSLDYWIMMATYEVAGAKFYSEYELR